MSNAIFPNSSSPFTKLLVGVGVLLASLVQAQSPEYTEGIPFAIASNVERCGAGSVTLTATGCTAGFTTKWYSATNRGVNLEDVLASGPTFTTPVLEETTHYFLACVSDTNSTMRGQFTDVFAFVQFYGVVHLLGDEFGCSNREASYQGFPKGGIFSIPQGLPEGFLTLDTLNSIVTLHPGFDVPTFEIGYTSTLPECSGTVTKSITRKFAVLPTVNNPTIYEGQTATLTIENCLGRVNWGYTYRSNAKRIYVSPKGTSEYSVRCEVVDGCNTELPVTVTVLPRPASLVTITGPDTICLDRLPLTFTATPAGGRFVLPQGVPSEAFRVEGSLLTLLDMTGFSNTSFGYEYEGLYEGEWVSASATKYLTFTAKPSPTITDPITICKGNFATLEVKNCPGEVVWDNIGQGPSFRVAPSVSTDYSARCITGGCEIVLTTRVTVGSNSAPIVEAESSICREETETYDVIFGATEGAQVTVDYGTIQGNTVVGIPMGQMLTLTAELDGCQSQSQYSFCLRPFDNCSLLKYFPITSSAATCSKNGTNDDAIITLNNTPATRISYAKSVSELADYDNARIVERNRIVISDLPNPSTPEGQVYHLRLFSIDGFEVCQLDTTVVVPYRDCSIECAKPDAGQDLFVSGFRQETLKLPTATSRQRWEIGEHPFMSSAIDASSGEINGVFASGRYTFILRDGGSGGVCTDTAYVFVGLAEVPELITYSDTITLPGYLLSAPPGAAFGQWTAMPGNPATLTTSGKVSGLHTPGRYLFSMTRPIEPNRNFLPTRPYEALIISVLRMPNPDCSPGIRCVPVFQRRIRLGLK